MFQDEHHASPICLLSLKAGGTGLNLTRANHVLHNDRWWNVQVHKFIRAGTMEDAIGEMIDRKQAIADKAVGTGEAWLTEFSNKELMQVFALRKEAIGD